jgi:fructokinase
MITVMGEALIRLARTRDATMLQAVPGGSALNVAVAAARLGYPAALIARLSRDLYGQELRRYAEQNGVDISGAPDADEPTIIAVDAAGLPAGPSRRARLYWGGGSAGHWSSDDLDGIPADTSMLHVGSLVLWDAASSARIVSSVGRLRRRGVLVWMDLKAYPEMMKSPGQGRILLEAPLRSADIIHASAYDLAWLYPGRSPQAVAEQWLGHGPAMVIVTSHKGIIVLRESGSTMYWPPIDAVRVVDEAGARDAFVAALLGALHNRAQKGEDVRALSVRALGHLLAVANLAAAITAERCGADFPTARELEERLAKQAKQRESALQNINGCAEILPLH